VEDELAWGQVFLEVRWFPPAIYHSVSASYPSALLMMRASGLTSQHCITVLF
jgi:hypothetical protein